MRTLITLVLFGGVIHAATVVTFVGTGEKGYSGDGEPATEAKINGPFGVTKGPAGSLYICDTMNHAVRKVDRETGIITTIAGSGPEGNPLTCRMDRCMEFLWIATEQFLWETPTHTGFASFARD